VAARLQQRGLAANAASLPGCLLDPACGALVLASDADALLRGGVPLDRFDVLVLDAEVLKAANAHAVLTLLKPHVSALVVAVNSVEIDVEMNALCSRFFSQQALHSVSSDEALLARVADLMRASDKAHAGMT